MNGPLVTHAPPEQPADRALSPEPWTREGRAYQERLTQILSMPTAMDTVCGHLANGGSVISLSEIWNVKPHHVMSWLRADEKRSERYELALKDRDEWAKEVILRELRFIACSDIRQLFTATGALKPVSEWPEELARAVSSLDIDELWEGRGKDKEQVGETKKIKLWNKLQAIELIGKSLAMWIDKHEHSGQVKLEDLLASPSIDEKNESEA